MGKMVPCSACGNEVSSKATSCPKCGHPVEKPSKFLAAIVWGLLIFVGLGQCARCVSGPSDKSTNSSATEVTPTPPPPTPTPDPKLEARVKKFGPPPVQSAWDGSYRVVERHLKDVANDPDSIKIAKCTEVSFHEKDGWLVACEYRGRNKFGGMVRNANWFVIRQSSVVRVEPMSRYTTK